jgi:hypothetical protein
MCKLTWSELAGHRHFVGWIGASRAKPGLAPAIVSARDKDLLSPSSEMPILFVRDERGEPSIDDATRRQATITVTAHRNPRGLPVDASRYIPLAAPLPPEETASIARLLAHMIDWDNFSFEGSPCRCTYSAAALVLGGWPHVREQLAQAISAAQAAGVFY